MHLSCFVIGQKHDFIAYSGVRLYVYRHYLLLNYMHLVKVFTVGPTHCAQRHEQ